MKRSLGDEENNFLHGEEEDVSNNTKRFKKDDGYENLILEKEEKYFDDDDDSNNSNGNNLEDDKEEELEKKSKLEDKVKQTDIRVLTVIKNKLDGESINKDVEKIRQQYLINYMKTVIEKLPISQQLIDTTNIKLDDVDEYLKMFSIARTCVHTQMQVQKLDTFNAIFDMMTRIVGKGIHDRIISPYLRQVVPQKNLDLAYASFQEALTDNGNDSNLSTELHCVTYLIQNEMEKSKPLKIPNPIFNRFAQQIKATSKYVTNILSTLASKPILPPSPPDRPPSPEREEYENPTFVEREYEFVDVLANK